MKNDRSMFFSVLAIATFATLATTARAAEEEYIARAVSVSGKVLARGDGGGSVQMTFLKPGDKLYKGSIVNTGSDGAVKLLMTDRTILDLGPSSLFKMNEYQLKKGEVGDRKVDMSLDYGTVRASVNEKLTSSKGKFTIRTKAATMGVRGTEFVVHSTIPAKDAAGSAIEPPKMSLTVMHGKVEVADSNAVAGAPPIPVTPGLQFAKSGDGLGQVAQLGTGEVAKIKADAFQKDMTFIQAVSFDPSTAKASNESAGATNKEAKNSEGKVEAKGDGKADGKEGKEGKSEGKGDKAEAKAPPASGGSQTIASIGATIESQSAEAPKPAIGDLKLPGTFTPDLPQSRPIDQLNGRLVNLHIRVCPTPNGC